MKNKTTSSSEWRKEMTLSNGSSAYVINVAVNANPQEVFQQLQVNLPTALILLSGGANDLSQLDNTSQLQLIQLFNQGIVRIAAELGAGFISGGTDSGVMAILGQAVAKHKQKMPLIGIAPASLTTPTRSATSDLVPLEPHHSHFVLVDTSEWGGEVEIMYGLAAIFAKQIPVFTLLVNGGELSRTEILHGVRLGFHTIVIEGSGRLADEIASLSRNRPAVIENTALAEIITDGTIHLFPLHSEIVELERLIYRLYRQLRGDTILRIAWQQFGLYDLNANRQQRHFRNTQLAILSLGVGGTALAVLQATLEKSPLFEIPLFSWLAPFLHYTIMLIPITTAALLAAANQFSAGNKWLLLRCSAEQIKSELFRYRTQAGIYNATADGETTREVKFAEKLQTIGRQVMQTEVNISALQPYFGVIPPPYSTAASDDGLRLLKPEYYIRARLEDQLFYYVNKAKKLERRFKLLHWLIYIIGGVGTLLAALGWQLWIALTTALVSALGTYLEYQQVEKNLLHYNQSATDLFNIRTWWTVLSEEEQANQANIDRLVGQTEQVLQGEFKNWFNEMQASFTHLKEKQYQDKKPENPVSPVKSIPPFLENTPDPSKSIDE